MRRVEPVSQIIQKLAAEFLLREAGNTSLITVTHADVTPDYKNVMIFLSVMPQSKEAQALAFAKRSRSELREYLKQHSALNPIPTVDFEIDFGEKNRQHIDELTKK